MRRERGVDPFENHAPESETTSDGYLRELKRTFRRVDSCTAGGSRVVVDVATPKPAEGVTTLAWDVGHAVANGFDFPGGSRRHVGGGTLGRRGPLRVRLRPQLLSRLRGLTRPESIGPRRAKRHSMPAPLSCPACGSTFDDRWRCHCGSPLRFADRPLPGGRAPDPDDLDRDRGLWAFDEFLPVGREVTLGEGWTPLVPSAEWDATFKLEYVFPTGSFKDRGAATTLSRAVELGVDTVVEDSSGNAGAAIATYAARAGVDAGIYVPADVKQSKLRAVERAGATPVRVAGSREDVTAACLEAVESGEGWYASHAWNPAFFAGTATFAFEIAAQRGWTVPDAVVTPLGHGTLFLGAYRGFRALHDAGWIDRLPRLLGAQAAGYAPIASALHATDGEERNELADGIRIREPVQREAILAAVDDTDGDVIALSADAVERELDALHDRGFYTEPTCAVAPAALRTFRDRGVVAPDDDVVVALTGSGLKE
jgi:threonine synthase